jgi:1-acyl-sn-glycerol-3-phosphate acyltransferase
VLLPRILISVFILLLLVVVTTVLLIGKKSSEPLHSGCRKYLLKMAFRLTMNLIAFITFWTVISSKKQKNINYEHYLGKEPQTESKKPVSMVVCNHTGFLEIMALILSPMHPSFTPKAEHKNDRILGPLCKGL